jgi:tetratricopeptide (TPR) repeat protein
MTPSCNRIAPRVLLSLLLIAVLAGSGCSGVKGMFKDKEADEGQPVEELYAKAHGLMQHGNWNGAEVTFRRLVAQYPYGPYTEQALVETAYAQYKAGKHDDAISSIDRFLRTYPTHRNTSYMYYLRGLVDSSRDTVFLQQVWRLDPSRRDLATPQQAYNDFQIVAERYPNSRTPRTPASAWPTCATSSPATISTSPCTTCAAPPTWPRPTGQARARDLPAEQVPERRGGDPGRRLHRPGQPGAGRRRQARAAAEPAGPSVPGRQMAGLPEQLAQDQSVRG